MFWRHSPFCENFGGSSVILPLSEQVVASLELQLSEVSQVQLVKLVFEEHCCKLSGSVEHASFRQLFDLELGHELIQFNNDLHFVSLLLS